MSPIPYGQDLPDGEPLDLDAPASSASLPRPPQAKSEGRSEQRSVTKQDRLRAVWRGFVRATEENGFNDRFLPLVWRNAPRAKGGGRIVAHRLATVIRWHHMLRPWLYPDPSPFPRINLWRTR